MNVKEFPFGFFQDMMMQNHQHHGHHPVASAALDRNAPLMGAEHQGGGEDQHHMDHQMSHDGGHHGMMMYFHGGFTEVILFDFWRIDSVGGLIGTID